MKIQLATAGAVLLGFGAVAAVPAFAYRGDPSVTGPNYTAERHETMTEAFAAGDYAAWKSQMGDRGPARKVTAENFARYAEAHKLSLEGKTEEAAQIRAELGLGLQDGSGYGQHGENGGRYTRAAR